MRGHSKPDQTVDSEDPDALSGLEKETERMALTSDGFGGTTKGRSDTSQTGRVPTSSGSTYNQNSRTSGGSTMPLQSSQSGRKTILSGPSVKCHQEALQFDRRLKKKELESFPSQDLASHLENLTSLMAAAGNTEKSNKYQRVLQSARDQLGSKEDSEQLRSVLVAGVMQARNDLGPLNNFEPFVNIVSARPEEEDF